MSTCCRKTVWMKTPMTKKQRNFQCLTEAPRIWPKILHFFLHRKYCDISQKSQVLLPLLDGFPMTNPHDMGGSAARGDAAVYQEICSPDWERDAQRKTGVSSCNGDLQKGSFKTKDTEGRGKTETIQTPFLQPHHSLCLHGNAVECFGVQQPRHFPLFPPTHPEGGQRDSANSYQKVPHFHCPGSKIATGSRVGTGSTRTPVPLCSLPPPPFQTSPRRRG